MSITNQSRTITVSALARVEGEGGLTICMHDGQVTDVQLRIYEPPRFFEGFLRGRSALEVPDITARICGICPVAYQMSSVHALEKIFGIQIPPELRALRRLLYCGEWIESHALHIYFLHAPDFLGYESALALAQASEVNAAIVRRGLEIKKAGNRIVQVLGGREVHPINIKVSGFYRVPRRKELQSLLDELNRARDATLETVRWTATLPFPDVEHDYEFVALRHSDEYPMNEGRVVSTRGLDILVEDFLDHFQEYQVPHSNALHSRRLENGNTPSSDPSPYFVGPSARWNLNADRVTPLVSEVAREVDITSRQRNPYASIIIRSLEMLQAIDEAIRIIENYQPPAEPSVDFQPCAGTGCAITEAPRGILYHRYVTDDKGLIQNAVIIPPTSQNQPQIENDLLRLAPQLVQLPDEEAALRAEHMIRNYDPCISCATHFLKLKVTGR